MRIIFMGTPEFAVPGLKKLHESSHNVIGVVTPPDTRKGRGLKICYSPVKQAALEAKLPVLQPESLKDNDFIESLRNLNAELFAVVGFRILPEVVFNLPSKGAINLHASLLPKYRGAAPVQWAIMNGESVTGVSTFFIQKKVDTGDLLLQKEVEILPEDDAGTLHDKLAETGADLLLHTIELIQQQAITARPQQGQVTPAPKIQSEHMQIDWERSACAVLNQIRAFSPRPGAFTWFDGKRLKIYEAIASDAESTESYSAGTVLPAEKGQFIIKCKPGALQIKTLQLEGKKRLSAEDFMRGIQVSERMRLGV